MLGELGIVTDIDPDVAPWARARVDILNVKDCPNPAGMEFEAEVDPEKLLTQVTALHKRWPLKSGFSPCQLLWGRVPYAMALAGD